MLICLNFYLSLFKTFAKVKNHRENIPKISEKILQNQIFRIKISKGEIDQLIYL